MYLVFDIGATNMRLAISKDGSTLDAPQIVPTPKEFEEGIELFTKVAKQISNDQPIRALAGGIAGPLDKEKTTLVHAPNLQEWIEKPLKNNLETAFDVPGQRLEVPFR